jgi:uncharacterized membrane protein
MTPMLAPLNRQPLILLHLLTAAAALLLGLVTLLRHKGTRSHRRFGRAWVALMAGISS